MSILNAQDLVNRQKEYIMAKDKLAALQEASDRGTVIDTSLIPFTTLQGALDDCIDGIQKTLGKVKFQWPPAGHLCESKTIRESQDSRPAEE